MWLFRPMVLRISGFSIKKLILSNIWSTVLHRNPLFPLMTWSLLPALSVAITGVPLIMASATALDHGSVLPQSMKKRKISIPIRYSFTDFENASRIMTFGILDNSLMRSFGTPMKSQMTL